MCSQDNLTRMKCKLFKPVRGLTSWSFPEKSILVLKDLTSAWIHDDRWCLTQKTDSTSSLKAESPRPLWTHQPLLALCPHPETASPTQAAAEGVASPPALPRCIFILWGNCCSPLVCGPEASLGTPGSTGPHLGLGY